MIEVEFNTDVDVSEAKRLVQEAVDKSRSDLPTDLPTEPTIREFDFSEMPIMYINISGNYDLNTLKKYSEILQDKIEEMKQITRVDMIGALDREIQINIDMNKLNAMGIGLDEVERGVMYENMRISGGNVNTDEMKRSLSISGEFKNIDQIKNIIVRSSGALPYI
jgi:multidrug efflux pump